MVIETEREEKTGRNSIDEASWAATAAALLPKLERGAWIAPSLISALSPVRNSFGRSRWAVGRGFAMMVLPALRYSFRCRPTSTCPERIRGWERTMKHLGGHVPREHFVRGELLIWRVVFADARYLASASSYVCAT